MLEIITRNPYRILGVYSNSALREIVANRGRINAFSKVGKQCPFPTDMTALAGAPERTPEAVQQADSALTIEADKLRFAQFWFMKGDGFNDQALKLAAEGRIADAVQILQSHNSVASLQNLVVLNLMRDNVTEATRAFARIYDAHASEFISAIGVTQGSASDLLDNYVSSVMEGNPSADPASLIGEGYPQSWNDAVKAVVARPLIQQLEQAIVESKKSKELSPAERLAAGRRLSRAAKPILMKLRHILTTKDLKLVNISDKVGNEVLQCAIDFYNGSNDLAAARDALPVAKDAQMIVMGSMAKQRCAENISTLQDNADSAPPAEVALEVSQIQQALNTYHSGPADMGKVGVLISNVTPALNSIRSKLGDKSTVYLYWTAAVTHSVLNVVIDIVNDLQNKVNEAPEGTALARGFFNRYKDAVEQSYNYLSRISTLGMDQDCRNRFTTNYNTLTDLYNQVQSINTSGSSDDGESKWSGCLVQVAIYLGIVLLMNLCS